MICANEECDDEVPPNTNGGGVSKRFCRVSCRPLPEKVPCPDCGEPKSKSAQTCGPCQGIRLSKTSRAKAGANDDGRICTKCGEFKVWDKFCNNSTGINGKSPRCLECQGNHQREAKAYLKAIGWTKDLWDACFFIQNGLCAVEGCGNPIEVADHCHETGEPRALLCRTCNLVLGQMKEDPERIRGLARYAEQCINVKDGS